MTGECPSVWQALISGQAGSSIASLWLRRRSTRYCGLRTPAGRGRQHDFGVDDFAFMGIVFLFLVVFRKQPFPALVGGGSNGRLALAALDDFQVKVRAWWHDGLWPPFSRHPGIEKAGNRSMISCSVVPPVGGWYLVLKVWAWFSKAN